MTHPIAIVLYPQEAAAAREFEQTPPLALCLPVEIHKTHDGDTATDVEVSLHLRVRYDRCWSPEINEPGGMAAAASAREVEGKRGRLLIPLANIRNLSDLFSFGRVIGTLWVDGSLESESQRQVRLKHASTRKGGELGT